METGLARDSDPDTSHAAAESVDATYLEGVVLAVVAKAGSRGMTMDEVEAALPYIRYGSITPRFRPLLEKGLLIDMGETRQGQSGRMQRVVCAVPVEGIEQAKTHYQAMKRRKALVSLIAKLQALSPEHREYVINTVSPLRRL